jgi:membrane protease YdiL (CAAX protease family)
MVASRLWSVLVAYLLAIAGIFAFSFLAIAVLGALYPDESPEKMLDSLPALVAGAVASSTALLLAIATVARPLDAAALRLRPGRERGRDLAVAIVGVLALGQTLDSLVSLAGLGGHGAMAAIRRAIEGAAGAELFAAVVTIGVLASAAEEVFFRGYMQSRLREQWPAWIAVVVTSAAFGLLHVERIHALLAFVLGLYLGFVTERAGSALPAVAAHMVNNALFTVLTATVGAVESARVNAVLAPASAVVFAACVWWLARMPRR